MNFDLNSLSTTVLIAAAFGAAFIAALWLSIIIWTARDIRSRTKDPMARILAVLVVILLFLPGLLIYAILRPSRTLEDQFHQSLEEEALLQTIEDLPLCPSCSRKVQKNWMLCPTCHTRLNKKCSQCKNLLELSWNLCPYCGSAQARKEQSSSDSLNANLPTLFDDHQVDFQESKDSKG